MTELKRWIESNPPAGLAELIDAARADEPRAAALSRTLLAVGAAGVVGSAAGEAAGVGFGAAGSGAPVAGTSAAGSSSIGTATLGGSLAGGGASGKIASATGALALMKWGLCGVTAGALAIGAAQGASHWVAAAPCTVPSTTSPPAVEQARIMPESWDIPATSPELAPAAASAAPEPVMLGSDREARASAPPPGEHSEQALAEEVRVLDRARSALAAGDAAAALAATDEHDRRFPHAQLAPEILYIRMRALEHAGDTAGSARAARRIVDEHSGAPQLRKAQQVLEQRDVSDGGTPQRGGR